MLKYKLESLDGLNDEQKALYKQEGNVYILQVDGIGSGDGDVAGLKQKVEDLLTENKTFKVKAREAEQVAETTRTDAAREKARKDGDIESIEKDYQGKIDVLTDKLAASDQANIDKDIEVQGRDLDRAAGEIAAGLADGANQKLITPFIRKRLIHVDGAIKVNGEDGLLTSATLEELSGEFKANDAYASLVTGSKASGGGAGNGDGGGSGASDIDWSKATPKEMAAAVKSKISD